MLWRAARSPLLRPRRSVTPGRRWLSSAAAPTEVGVAVVGGSGYTGAELIRLLAGHPYAKVRAAPFPRAALALPPALPR